MMIGAIERVVFHQRVAVFWFLAGVTSVVALAALGLTVSLDPSRHVPDSHAQVFQDLRAAGAVEGEIAVLLTLRDGELWTGQGLDHVQRAEQALRTVRRLDSGSIASILSPSILMSSAVEKAATFELQAMLRDRPAKDWTLEDIRWWQAISKQLGLENRLVAPDGKGAVIRVLLDPDMTATGADYRALAADIETVLNTTFAGSAVDVAVAGFPVRIGRLEAAMQAAMPLAIGLLAIALFGLWLAGRSLVLSAAGLATAAMPVIWLGGGLALSGMAFDPVWLMAFAMVFGIGILTACLVIGLFVAEICWSRAPEEAARSVFRVIVWPGAVAMICAGISALALTVLPVAILRDAALLVLAGTVLSALSTVLLLPLVLASVTLSEAWVAGMSARADRRFRVFDIIAPLAQPRMAGAVTFVILALTVGVGLFVETGTQGRSGSVLALGTETPAAQLARSQYGFLTDSYAVRLDLDRAGCEDEAILRDAAQAPFDDLTSMTALKAVGPVPDFFDGREGRLQDVRRAPHGLLRSSAATVRVEQVLGPACGYMRFVAGAEVAQAAVLPARLAHVTTELKEGAQGSALLGPATRAAMVPGEGSLGALAKLDYLAETRAPIVLTLMLALLAVGAFAAQRDWRAMMITLLPVACGAMLTIALLPMLSLDLSVGALLTVALTGGFGSLAIQALTALWARAEGESYDTTDAFVSTMSAGAPAIGLSAMVLAIGLISLVPYPLPFAPLMAVGVAVQAVLALTFAPALLVLSRWAFPTDALLARAGRFAR